MCFAATLSVSAFAAQLYHYDIVRQDLVEALNEWSQTSEADYLAEPSILTGLTAAPVTGAKDRDSALRALLQGTGLSFRQLPRGSYLIERIPQAKPAQRLEEIKVTGYRGAFRKSLDIKKHALDVSDAISSLEINRFPDNNLAESLQRIPGVSIDRDGNEGNKITVRGMGPDFNLVTWNGRRTPVTAMPDIYNASALAPASRSFEFINLASSGIESVLVYKTSDATRPSGGIGAVVDVQTPRPIELSGQFADLGIKAVRDFSQGDYDGELSLIAGKKFGRDVGIYLNASEQNRSSQVEAATIAGWVDPSTSIGQWYVDNIYEIENLIEQDLRVDGDGLYWAPLSQYFSVTDETRERKNLQASLQFAFLDKGLLTLDSSNLDLHTRPDSRVFGAQFFGVPRDTFFGQDLRSSIAQSGTVTRMTKTDGVYHYERTLGDIRKQSDSDALNIEYELSKRWRAELDYSKARADASRSTLNLQALELGADTISFDNRSSVPVLTVDVSNPFTPANITTLTEPQPYTTFDQNMRHELMQTRLSALYFADAGLINRFEFGFEKIDSQLLSSVNESVFVTQWQLNFNFNPQTNQAEEFFQSSYVGDILDDFDGGLRQQGHLYTSRFHPHDAQTLEFTGGQSTNSSDSKPLEHHRIQELSDALFVQAELSFDSPWQAVLGAGLRFEKTKTRVTSLVDLPVGTEWANPAFTYVRFAPQREYLSADAEYSNLLPNLLLRFTPLKSTVARASLSRTIAPSDPTQMRNETRLLTQFGTQRKARAGNPKLKPYTSDNLDFSVEWYYDKSSYAALAVFAKSLNNFVADTTTRESLYELRDVYNGERANQARQELLDEGISTSNANVLQRIIENGGGSGVFNANGDEIVTSDDTDPIIIWDVDTPSNDEKVKVQGVELSLQHRFNGSGWGAYFNATLVDSNKRYKLRELGYQFAIPGLSNTLNAVVFYENDIVDLRLAYNWRDLFLSDLSTFTGDQPQFTESHAQWDFSLAVQLSRSLDFNLNVINVLGQDQRIRSRYQDQLISASQFESVYSLGLDYSFD